VRQPDDHMHGPLMDQTTPKTGASLDSTLLVTMTVGQLRDLVRAEIQAARTGQQDAERWMDAKEAAELLSMSEDWLYRHAKTLPFTRKLGHKMLRFSYQGLVKYMETRTRSRTSY
jgi:predicted DNA-binding transcriptional regulator AlpA